MSTASDLNLPALFPQVPCWGSESSMVSRVGLEMEIKEPRDSRNFKSISFITDPGVSQEGGAYLIPTVTASALITGRLRPQALAEGAFNADLISACFGDPHPKSATLSVHSTGTRVRGVLSQMRRAS